MSNYCPLCGNTGIDINGNPCTCRINIKSFYDRVSCLDIPEQYRGVKFNKLLVPNDIDESYANYLQTVHDDIIKMSWITKNAILCSPINHSKSILAYSCIESLFRQGVPTFPIFDVLELKRILTDLDLGKQPFYDVIEPERALTVPILFVKIPRVVSYDVYDSAALLLDRRVRRNNSTIFIFDGTWNQLIFKDKQGIISGLAGDGTFGSLIVKSYGLKETNGLPDIKLDEDKG